MIRASFKIGGPEYACAIGPADELLVLIEGLWSRGPGFPAVFPQVTTISELANMIMAKSYPDLPK